jgi:acyl-CoA reductase-like NAD-dependent aldehyde dehydrogenase
MHINQLFIGGEWVRSSGDTVLEVVSPIDRGGGGQSLPADTSQPFGGMKSSGIGRAFGPEGLLPQLECKTVNVPRELAHRLKTQP